MADNDDQKDHHSASYFIFSFLFSFSPAHATIAARSIASDDPSIRQLACLALLLTRCCFANSFGREKRKTDVHRLKQLGLFFIFHFAFFISLPHCSLLSNLPPRSIFLSWPQSIGRCTVFIANRRPSSRQTTPSTIRRCHRRSNSPWMVRKYSELSGVSFDLLTFSRFLFSSLFSFSFHFRLPLHDIKYSSSS